MKRKLGRLFRLLSGLVLFAQSGCWQCSVEREFNHPARPLQVHGWKQFKRGSVTVDGDFVLELGKSIDNGRIGVRLVSVTPAKCRAFKEPEYPSVRVQFYNAADGKVVCESIFQPGSAFLRRPHVCGENFEWDVIGISAINAAEKWVAFELVK